MKPLSEFTRDELSLLLYLESCAVDFACAIDSRKMNAEDEAILTEWCEIGFAASGRVSSEFLTARLQRWAKLSDEGMALAQTARLERAKNGWAKRHWTTTEEKRTPAPATGDE